MKNLLAMPLAVTLLALAASANAQDSDYAGLDAQTVAQIQSGPSYVPGGVVLAAIERRLWVGKHHTDNLVHPIGQKPLGKRDRMLGFLSYEPFEGGHTLFNCWVPEDVFTSVREDCEGHNKWPRPIIGYIASTQLPGTVPLYRCFRNIPGNYNHFDSLDANCEGVRSAIMEGVQGYVWL